MTGSVHQLDETRVLHPDNTVQQQAVVGRTWATLERLREYFPQS